eukprot:352199-Chlamydomonas_euryale.AAC.18
MAPSTPATTPTVRRKSVPASICVRLWRPLGCWRAAGTSCGRASHFSSPAASAASTSWAACLRRLLCTSQPQASQPTARWAHTLPRHVKRQMMMLHLLCGGRGRWGGGRVQDYLVSAPHPTPAFPFPDP